MRTDASPLTAAAQRKRQSALERAQEALAGLDRDGLPVTFQSVAARAGVSRQWLYKNPELRAAIESLRARERCRTLVPVAQRTSDVSLRQRNLALLEDNKRLRRENTELKEQCARLIGELRARGPGPR